ncbi:MAG: hypothetical protein LBE38_06665 [Deltaproteobacteria bacterium]|jgi:nicotinamide-nucleotide amidase|nr:hypothetical protein [Deltaproteobacteria bacterium]
MPTAFRKSRLKAAVIASGSELTLGRSLDTNSAYISRKLAALGVKVEMHQTVPDDFEVLAKVIKAASLNYQVVVMTGGLGPTEDDFTRLAAAKAFGVPLSYSWKLAKEIDERMSAYGSPAPANNLRQSWIPKYARVISNPYGTAPSFAIVRPGNLSLFLPGVPKELERLIDDNLETLLFSAFPASRKVLETHTLVAVGLGESRVDALISDLMNKKNPSLGITAGPYETKIHVTAEAKGKDSARELINPIIRELEKRLGSYLTGTDGRGLFAAVANEISLRGFKLGIMDFLTQGLFTSLLLPHLTVDNFAGSITLAPGSPIGPNPLNYLLAEGATLTLSLTCKNPAGTKDCHSFAPPEASGPSPLGGLGKLEKITLSTRIIHSPEPGSKLVKGPNGRDFFQITPLSAPSSNLANRVSMLAAFQLWSFMREEK